MVSGGRAGDGVVEGEQPVQAAEMDEMAQVGGGAASSAGVVLVPAARQAVIRSCRPTESHNVSPDSSSTSVPTPGSAGAASACCSRGALSKSRSPATRTIRTQAAGSKTVTRRVQPQSGR